MDQCFFLCFSLSFFFFFVLGGNTIGDGFGEKDRRVYISYLSTLMSLFFFSFFFLFPCRMIDIYKVSGFCVLYDIADVMAIGE